MKMKLPKHLRWCGLMGHPFVVLRPDTDKLHGDGEYSCYSECPTLASALDGFKRESGNRVFQQLPGRKWREVTPNGQTVAA